MHTSNTAWRTYNINMIPRQCIDKGCGRVSRVLDISPINLSYLVRIHHDEVSTKIDTYDGEFSHYMS